MSDEDLAFAGCDVKADIMMITSRGGCEVHYHGEQVNINITPIQDPVNIVGAGDAFTAMLVY